MTHEATEAAPQRPPPTPAPAGAAIWLREALRSALFLRPRWAPLVATPRGLLLLVALGEGLSLLIDRLLIVGPAALYPRAFGMGWLLAAALAAACWLLRREQAGPPRAADLFALVWLQGIVIGGVCSLWAVPIVRAGLWGPGQGALLTGLVWLPSVWMLLAMLNLVARSPAAGAAGRQGAVALLALAFVVGLQADPPRYWYAQPDAAAGAAAARITPEQLEAQPRLFAEQTAALAPERRGTIDVYALTFAPYADEDVFRRESDLVAEVMASRFDAAGRTLQLVNHRDTFERFVLATPRNLERAIRAVASRMNRDEDILFLHLTSHGAASGALAAALWPLHVDEVRPAQVKAWLDEAGVRHRIVSVSACYSGTWIQPLADENTLVMSAADPGRTSYGCGRHSELTYFGRAMYDEQLRRTWSFEQAHAAARGVIEQREREAGKADGYSNPQLHLGAALRPVLAALEAQLAQRVKP